MEFGIFVIFLITGVAFPLKNINEENFDFVGNFNTLHFNGVLHG